MEASLPLSGPLSPPSISVAETPATPSAHDAVRKQEGEIKGKSWKARAQGLLDELDRKLEKAIPQNKAQDYLDGVGEAIENLLSHPLAKTLNNWIDSNDHKSWYTQLATFIVKLPFRAVRNIARLVYNVVKATVYTFVHPLKALNNVAKFVIQMIHALKKPETYTKMGAGLIGASLGQVAMSGGFGLHAYIGLGIGGGLLLAGLTAGAIVNAVKAEKGEGLATAKHNLWEQIKTVPEFMLTGFIIGVIFGAINNSLHKQETTQTTHQVQDTSNAQNYVNSQFLPQYHLPPATNITVDPSGNIIISYKGSQLTNLINSHNQFYMDAVGGYKNIQPQLVDSFNITLHAPNAPVSWPQMLPGTNVETLGTGNFGAGGSWRIWSVSGQIPTYYPVGPASTQTFVTATQVTSLPLLPAAAVTGSQSGTVGLLTMQPPKEK